MKVCLFDGYIRNRVQLCEELAVDSDDERGVNRAILEAAYARWGHDMGNHICGAFALVMQDEGSGALFCARDPLGLRPLYYGCDVGGTLRFGGNPKDVASGMADCDLDPEALQRYLMLGYPVGETTLFRGIKKLMPGHYLMDDENGLVVRPYFSLEFQPDFSRTDEGWATEIEQTFEKIVAEDAEVLEAGGSCSFLSGGVDSSYMLAMSGARRAYGVGYAEEASSEAEVAAQTAKYLGAEFREVRVTSDQFFEAIPRVVRAAGLPVADASTVALLLGSEEVARDATCCLSGEGADELFAGYHTYRRVNEIGQSGGPWHFGCSRLMRAEDAQHLLKLPRSYPMEDLVRDIYDATESGERLSRLQAIDLALWFEGDILLGANAVARASGLNLLLPYSDRRMVDLATRVPADLRLKDGCGKYVLRKAAARRLPDEVAFRAKVGFSVPIRVWMREEARREELESVLLGGDSARFFDQDMVRSYWESFLDGDDYLWHIVYALYVFLIWYRECFA